MKGNRGVTLTSLIVYIIGMLIMLATLATLRTFFSKNVDIRAINDDTIQYSKFASAFSTETNTKDNKVIECRTQIDEKEEKVSYIVFSNSAVYLSVLLQYKACFSKTKRNESGSIPDSFTNYLILNFV